MPITLGVTRDFEFTGNDLAGRACLFPRDPRNSTFVQLTNLRTKIIAADPAKYLAFPFQVTLGSSIICLHSDGDAHASSDRQIMSRSDDGGLSWTSVVFTSSLSPEFNTSLLDGLLSNGQAVCLKVWSIENDSGALVVSTVSTVSYLGVVYALWSRIIGAATGLTWYRTGYGVNGTNTECALFQSTDNGKTWTFKSTIFAAAGRNYSEASIIRTSGNNLVAICREDTGTGNPLYRSTSNDDGATWTTPVAIPTSVINGRQPNLLKTTNGRYILCTGDRAGVSGLGGGGEDIFGVDETGVAMVTSADCENWGPRTMLASIYSTDGGQPMAVETTPNRVCITYYQRKAVNKQPIIAATILDTAEL